MFDEAAALSATLLGDDFKAHSSVSGCDGWGWKLENACNSQAHGMAGEVGCIFCVVNEILRDLTRKEFSVLCGCASNHCPGQQHFQRVRALAANRLETYPTESHFFVHSLSSHAYKKGFPHPGTQSFSPPHWGNTCGEHILQ